MSGTALCPVGSRLCVSTDGGSTQLGLQRVLWVNWNVTQRRGHATIAHPWTGDQYDVDAVDPNDVVTNVPEVTAIVQPEPCSILPVPALSVAGTQVGCLPLVVRVQPPASNTWRRHLEGGAVNPALPWAVDLHVGLPVNLVPVLPTGPIALRLLGASSLDTGCSDVTYTNGVVTGLLCRPGTYVVVITVAARVNSTATNNGSSTGPNSNSDNSVVGVSKGDSIRSIVMRPYVLAALAIGGVALLSVLVVVVSARGRHKKGRGSTVVSPLPRNGSQRSNGSAGQARPAPSPRLVQVMPATRRTSGSGATRDVAPPVGGATVRVV